MVEQLGQPGGGGDELDTHADEGGAAQDQQPRQAGGEASRKRRKGVDEDAPGQDAAAAETIGEVAAEQTKYAATHRRDVEQQPQPTAVFGGAELESAELGQRRPIDERKHQQLIGVERESNRGN